MWILLFLDLLSWGVWYFITVSHSGGGTPLILWYFLKPPPPPQKKADGKLSLILVYFWYNNTGKRWQKFHKNMIFLLGAFKILWERWNSLLENIIITWLIYLANQLYDAEKFLDFILCQCVIRNCLVLLRNFVNKPLEQNSV